MRYSKDEVLQYVQEEDVKFIRLTFCDVFGNQKNIAIMPDALPRVFENGVAFDASAIAGFGDVAHSDLLLHPEPDTLMPLPWRPEHGRVMQMFSTITYPNGDPFECDTRGLLKSAVAEAEKKGYHFRFGAVQDFYLFLLDEHSQPTRVLCDEAGYMDIAPEDHGENVRREVCLTLEQMGVRPESSHHEEGPGQNAIDLRCTDALTAADHVQIFQRVVKTVADRNGFFSNFSPRPLENAPGNGFHIKIARDGWKDEVLFSRMMAGILAKIKPMTLFMNPSADSYQRLGRHKAPGYISWSSGNYDQLLRLPSADASGRTGAPQNHAGASRCAKLRSPDPSANPYLALTLLIHAGLEGIEKELALPEPADFNLRKADPEISTRYERLPQSRAEAGEAATSSSWIRAHIPSEVLAIYRNR